MRFADIAPRSLLPHFIAKFFIGCRSPLKIIHGNSGLFVAMPSRKRPDGEHQDLAHPINDATRKYLTDTVMAVYQRELASQGSNSGRPAEHHSERIR
jgi:DNA-binding cell septation regulator SpoVG